jgi:hypothetical protein
MVDVVQAKRLLSFNQDHFLKSLRLIGKNHLQKSDESVSVVDQRLLLLMRLEKLFFNLVQLLLQRFKFFCFVLEQGHHGFIIR